LNGAVLRLMRVGRILICVHTTNKDRLLLLLLLLLSLAESPVTPSPGVEWLQACGRSNTREAALPSDTTLALSVQT